jgi:RNA polymerase sigma factor (sigma-70 family)
MFKTFKTKEGITTIEISQEGKVTYAVGKKKTTFDLSDCDSFTYEFEAMDERLVITKDMIARNEAKDTGFSNEDADEVEPWLWLVISKGEERLQYNNDQTESRRHYSYSDQNDKIDTLMAGEDLFETVFEKLEKEELIEAIKALEPQQQELVKDLFYEGMSMSEIARRDGVSKMSISKRMNTIKKHLKEKIKNF